MMSPRLTNIFVVLCALLAAGAVFAPLASRAANDTTLIVNLPGASGGTVSGINQYIERIYRAALIIGAFLAMLLIVVGATQWGLSAGSESAKSDARSRITNAIMGLVLLLAVALILFFVNPALVSLQSPGGAAGGGQPAGVNTLTAPTNVVVTRPYATLPNKLKVTWNNNSTVVANYQFRAVAAGTNGFQLIPDLTVGGSSVGQIQADIDDNNYQLIKVVAVGQGQNPATQESGAATVPASPFAQLSAIPSQAAAPSNFQCEWESQGQKLILTWTNNASNVAGFHVYLDNPATTGPPDFTDYSGSIAPSNTSVSITPTINPPFTLKLGARNAQNEYVFSSELTVWPYNPAGAGCGTAPQGPPPPQPGTLYPIPSPLARPGNLVFTWNSSVSGVLSWENHANNVVEFNVYHLVQSNQPFGGLVATLVANVPVPSGASATAPFSVTLTSDNTPATSYLVSGQPFTLAVVASAGLFGQISENIAVQPYAP